MNPSDSALKAARMLSVLVAAILVLMPFHAFLTTWLASNFGRIDLFRAWKEIVLIGVLPVVIWLGWRNQKLRSHLLNSWITKLFAAYLLLHLIMGFWALQNNKVTAEALAYSYLINLRFIGFFLICLIVASYSGFLYRNWRKIILLPAAAIITFGLLQKLVLPYDFLRRFGYGQSTVPAYQTVDSQVDLRRIQSFLRGANPLGAYLILIITAVISVMRKNRIYLVVSLLLLVAVLFFSYSRSAWLGLIAAGTFSAGYLALRKNASILMLILVSVSLFGGLGIYLLRNNSLVQETVFHERAQSPAPLNSNDVRLQSLKQGAKDVLNQPLGRGPGTAGPASFRNDGKSRISENYYLQIGQETGLLGMLIFIAINIIVGFQLWARRNQQLPKVLLASLIGISVVNLFQHAWADDTLSYLWWGLAGIALAPAILTPRHKQNGKILKVKTPADSPVH